MAQQIMDGHKKTEEELVKELQGLQQEYKSLRILYDRAIHDRNQTLDALRESEAQNVTACKLADHELVKAKERAEESDRLKSAFLANMSHEIRTPMHGILGFAELLKEPDLTEEEQQKYIGIIEKSGIRMLNIINDIISISKVESGQMNVSVSETNINEQLEFIYNFFKPEVEQKGLLIFLNSNLSANDSVIKTDREKVYAILTNLTKNAIKFTDHGFIEIGCVKKGRFLEFFVKDTGMGIPENKKSSIFERFIQGSDLITRKFEGSGLGLSISKAYVEILGGSIWVESAEGTGSIFYFTIPGYVDPCEENQVASVLNSDNSTFTMQNEYYPNSYSHPIHATPQGRGFITRIGRSR